MEENSPLRVLLFPWLTHGHVFPFLELAKTLSNKNFHIYFCSTSINLNSIKNSFKTKSLDEFSIELVELNLSSMDELPPQYHTTKNIPPHLMPTLMKAFQMSSSDFADIFNDIKPDLLVYDGFQPWAAKLAASQSIPAIIFSTSGATTTSFFHHLHTYKSFDAYPYPDIYLRDYAKRELFAQGESIKNEDEGEGFAFGTFQLSHEIILIRSCMAIEGKYFDYFSKLCGKEILPVGPLITRNNDENNKNSEILHWLNKKDPSLTLYISFGSENYLSKNQIQEIAKGLELSNIIFIWVVRFPTGSEITIEDMLPEGFLDRVKERGIVENGWAPQADILAHETVGGFMSHCGWGSVIESTYFGVPVLAVPLKLDQPVNARLMVETGVGVEVERDGNGVFTGEDVAEAISEVIAEKSGEGFRCKAKELSEKMKMEEAQMSDKVAERLRSLCIKQ